MKKISILGTVGVLALAGLAGCSSDNNEPVEEVIVEEVQQSEEPQSMGEVPVDFVIDNEMVGQYTLTGFNTEGVQKDVEEFEFQEPIFLTINEYGNVHTNICNVINTQINDEGETSGAVSTMMFCEQPEGIMEVEDAVSPSMSGVVATDSESDGIVFIGVDGNQSFWKFVNQSEVEDE